MSSQDSLESFEDAPILVDLPEPKSASNSVDKDGDEADWPTLAREKALVGCDAIGDIVKKVQTLGISTNSTEFHVVFQAMLTVYIKERFGE